MIAIPQSRSQKLSQKDSHMKTAYLLRAPSTDEGTFGYMLTQDGIWNSLELPDRGNAKNISRIPNGEYTCVIRRSPRFGITFHVTGVDGRTYILIHSANFAGDVAKGYQSHLNGCISMGMKRGAFNNKFGNKQKAILLSRKAVREFRESMGQDPFKLIIKDLYV